MASKFYTRFHHERPVSPHGGVSMTHQEFADECDINKVLTKYQLTGVPPISKPMQSGDFSDIGDFAQVYARIHEAERLFSTVDARIRDRFGNDPRAFFAFVNDPANQSECLKLGLMQDNTPKPSAMDVLEKIAVNTTPVTTEVAK